MIQLTERYKKLWLWEYNHIVLERFSQQIVNGRKHGRYRTSNPERLKFEIMRLECKSLGEKHYIKPPGGYYKCENELNTRYYCNYKTCPMLFNRNGANE